MPVSWISIGFCTINLILPAKLAAFFSAYHGGDKFVFLSRKIDPVVWLPTGRAVNIHHPF